MEKKEEKHFVPKFDCFHQLTTIDGGTGFRKLLQNSILFLKIFIIFQDPQVSIMFSKKMQHCIKFIFFSPVLGSLKYQQVSPKAPVSVQTHLHLLNNVFKNDPIAYRDIAKI